MLLPQRLSTHGIKILATILVLLAGCVDNRLPDPDAPPPDQAALDLLVQHRYQEAATVYLQLAEKYKAPLKQDYQLRAADALVEAQDFVNAKHIAESLSTKGLTAEHNDYRHIILGTIALRQSEPEQVLGFLRPQDAFAANPTLLLRYHLLRARALEQTGQPLSAATERSGADEFLVGQQRDANRQHLWNNLTELTVTQLENALSGKKAKLSGWINLAIIAKQFITDTAIFERAVTHWSILYVNHPASAIIPELLATSLRGASPPAHIALLLPLAGSFAKAGAAVRDGFLAAWFEDAGNPERPQISVWNTFDKNIEVVYGDATTAGADFVVGPLDKPSVTTLVKTAPLVVNTLTLNHANDEPTLIDTADQQTSGQPSPKSSAGIVYQFALSPEEESRLVAERAWFEGCGNVALVLPEGSWGHRVGNAFTNAWTNLGGVVVDQMMYQSGAADMSPPISALLGVDQSKQRYRKLRQTLGLDLKYESRRRQDLDFVFMAAFPRQARLIKPQLRFHHAADLPVFSTSHVYAGVPDPPSDTDIDGVWFGDMPWVLYDGGAHGRLRYETQRVWGSVFDRYARLYAFGADAYYIVPHLGRLRAQPSAELSGETGGLSVGPNNQVHRRLEWARFVDGLPTLIDDQDIEQ